MIKSSKPNVLSLRFKGILDPDDLKLAELLKLHSEKGISKVFLYEARRRARIFAKEMATA